MTVQSNEGSGSLSEPPVLDGYFVNISAGQPAALTLPSPASSMNIRNTSNFYVTAVVNTVTGGFQGDLTVLVQPGGTHDVSYDSNIIGDVTLQFVQYPQLTPNPGWNQNSMLSPLPGNEKGVVLVTFA